MDYISKQRNYLNKKNPKKLDFVFAGQIEPYINAKSLLLGN